MIRLPLLPERGLDEPNVLKRIVETINAFLRGEQIWPRTAAERLAGVYPTDYFYEPGDVRRYGALGDNSTDDSAAIDRALSLGGRVFIASGLTCLATNLTMSVANTEFQVMAGATLSQTTATNKLITISGADCVISGGGKILSPGTFDGTNSQRTYAVLWITANGVHVKDITMDTIPRSGIHFENAGYGRVSNCKLLGKFPYASYTGSNTGHAAIDYDMPTSSYTDKVGLVVTGCLIETSVQGVLSGNFGDAALEAGITISGNTFNQCWDHGVYLSGSEGNVITGNSFVSCKAPIVVDGVGSVVSGNSLYSTEPSQSNGNQFISVRDAYGAVISGNTIYGLGAAILVDCVSGTTMGNNVIANNTIVSTGAGLADSGIRLGSTAQTCDNNIIEHNYISGANYGEFVGAIQLEMASTYTGRNNVVRNNTIKVGNKCYNLNLLRQSNAICEGNILESTHSAGGASTYIMLNVDTSDECDISRNTFVWRTGGSNITARGINVGSGCTDNRITTNRFKLTSGSLTASDEIVNSGTDTYVSRNQVDCTVQMHGSFTWTTTTASHNVTNANCLTTSVIMITPRDANAGVVINSKGYYVTPGTGSFTIYTGDGTNTAAASDWDYEII